jgi:hypothetical protein
MINPVTHSNDGMERQDEAIPLVDDRRNRSVEIVSMKRPA